MTVSVAMPLAVLLSVAIGVAGCVAQAEGEELPKLLAYLESAIPASGYLVGDRLSGADINMAYLLEVATASKQIGDRPNLIAYLESVSQ